MLFLDLALQQYIKTLADRIIHLDIGFEALMREVHIIVRNLSMTYRWEELQVCVKDFELALRLTGDLQAGRGDIQDTSRKIKSITDRLRQVLG